jgi:inosine-uridine nucleoside N-ribohydrolase
VKKINVWLDCDPGLDDSFAIILASSHERINLLGISTSPGNTTLENTTQNALDILHNIGKSHIPVVVGCRKPFTS